MDSEPAWTTVLTPSDREACLRELEATAGTDRFDEVQRSWRETAEAISAGLGRKEPEWLEDPTPAERP
ncbi:hypothetical protein GMA10_01320 [Kocuria koreensis]|uniref:Uncharacterized protein n=1 Tax=Rothia koreensis TaxID=592378 RepID=A0A7K1LFI2_9MICC|nr:hypothetical protein [Rothia koreensis]MUN53878.1 hypothetical protein [Rothia koreensis]